MKNIKNIMLAISIVTGVCAIALSFYNYLNLRKVVVVDVIRLVNSFEMKIEMEQVEGNNLNKYKTEIDSLRADFKIQSDSKADHKILEQKYQAIQDKEKKFQEAYAKSNELITKSVWDKLNTLIDGFARENHYEIIIGANGMGSVLYMKNEKDITEDLIKYVNEVYRK